MNDAARKSDGSTVTNNRVRSASGASMNAKLRRFSSRGATYYLNWGSLTAPVFFARFEKLVACSLLPKARCIDARFV